MEKIILVDDHALFREGMKLLIETEGIGMVVAEAENGKEFLELLDTHSPDLVILDIEMPVMGGLEALRKAKKIQPDIKILVLTMLSEKGNYSDMVSAGARIWKKP
jgi:DNA-binding NarL/FixJ family response regulator